MEKPPPLFKALTAYLNRADDLDKNDKNPDNKIISYYCRMWALTKGFEINKAQACIDESEKKTMETYLMKLMTDLENRKKTLNITKEEAKSKCEKYAFEMFDDADIEDQTGTPTQFTAAKYYNAKTYFDILEFFGPLNEDIKERIKIAGVRALQINKAIKAGQIPLPSSSSIDISTNASAPPAPPIQNIQQQQQQHNNNNNNNNNNQYIATSSTYSHTPSNNFSPITQVTQAFNSLMPMGQINSNASSETKYKDCTELCHFAIAALKHNDANLAKERLQEALKLLG